LNGYDREPRQAPGVGRIALFVVRRSASPSSDPTPTTQSPECTRGAVRTWRLGSQIAVRGWALRTATGAWSSRGKCRRASRSIETGPATSWFRSQGRAPRPATVAAVHREPIILADRNNVPTVYSLSEAARDGGLLSYGVDLVFRRAATYVDRVLHGEKPGDLPVQFPTKIKLVMNLKTVTWKINGLSLAKVICEMRSENGHCRLCRGEYAGPAFDRPA
jgi:hypothetical protein